MIARFNTHSRIRSIRFKDIWAIAAIGVAFGLAWPWRGTDGGKVIFVSPAGSDWNSGGSRDSALRSIQRAADLAMPGDRIQIMPGVYRERIHLRRGGTAAQPVVIEAFEPGTVTISGAAEPEAILNLQWTDDGDGIYSASTAWPIYYAVADGQCVFRVAYGGVESLRQLVGRPNAWGAFCYADGRVYVSLRDRSHPIEHQLEFNRHVPPPREWGEFKSANVWVEADFVELRGLRFEFGIGAGVSLWDAEHVTIEDCLFAWATHGIRAGRGAKPSRHITVANCFYHNYPQGDWHRSWLNWHEIYAVYSSSSLMSSSDDDVRISDCLVTHAGDALQVSNKDLGSSGVEITRNVLALTTDDAAEFDGQARSVRFYNNLVYDCYVGLSLSPTQGPVDVHGNVFLHSSESLGGAHVKIMGTPRPGRETRDVEIRNNVMIGNWLCWWNEMPTRDVHVHNNDFSVAHRKDPPWPPGVVARENFDGTPAGSWESFASRGRGGGREIAERRLFRKLTADGWNPGPRWLDRRNHSATRDVAQFLEHSNLLATSTTSTAKVVDIRSKK